MKQLKNYEYTEMFDRAFNKALNVIDDDILYEEAFVLEFLGTDCQGTFIDDWIRVLKHSIMDKTCLLKKI